MKVRNMINTFLSTLYMKELKLLTLYWLNNDMSLCPLIQVSSSILYAIITGKQKTIN